MGFLKSNRDPLWWPKSGTEEVIFGAILTQQTKWEKVESSLDNLMGVGIGTLEAIAQADTQLIAACSKPSGFYNTKAERIKLLSKHIIESYGTFGSFQEKSDREWLLGQKGIGMESADSILCYGCKRDAFVIDSYTVRLLEAFGYRFENYGEIQEWMRVGLEENFDKVKILYGEEISRNQLYARMHGKIVEFAKEYIRGKKVDLSHLLHSLNRQES